MIERRVNGGDLPLAEGVVERGVDEARRHTHSGCRIPIDHQRGLQSLVLLIGIDVDQLRQLAHRLADARLPGPKLAEIIGLQRVLIGGIRLPAAHADVLDWV